MNDTSGVPIIRKGTYKAYLRNGVFWGLIIGVLFFLLSLTDNSAVKSLWIGFWVWVCIIVLIMGVGFPSEEYIRRKKKIRKLTSPQYSFLRENGFVLHQDLYFEGVYHGYSIRVTPMRKWLKPNREVEYVFIEALYEFQDGENSREREMNLCGEYFVGRLMFAHHCAGFVPKDWEQPDFKENLDGLVNILKRENLAPISKDEWEGRFGKKLKEERMNEEKSRTKQILKIGPIDLKYIKPKK